MDVEIVSAVERRARSTAVWFVLWGALGLLSVVETVIVLTGVASRIVSVGRWGLFGGVVLGAAAAIQLASGLAFLSRKEKVLAGVALILFGYSQLDRRLMSDQVVPVRYDFSAYYVAGRLAAEHPPGRLYYQAVYPDGRISTLGSTEGGPEVTQHYGVSHSTFIYLPFSALLFKPFARFSYGATYAFWTIFTVLLTLASVVICLNLGGRRLDLRLGSILIVGLFSYAPFFQELVLGQVSSLILFLCALGVWLLSRARNWSSAFCFAVATMIKITPALAVPLLILYRKWKWLAAYSIWMVILTGLSIWQIGWPAHEEFLHRVMPSLSCGIAYYGNISVANYVQELFLGFAPTGAQSTLPPLACTISKLVSFAVLCGLMIRFYLYRREENLVLHFSLMMLLSLAISPITWQHHCVIALLPFLYLWCRLGETDRDGPLLGTVLVLGTTFVPIVLPFFFSHLVLVVEAIVPCLMVALVYREASGGKLVSTA